LPEEPELTAAKGAVKISKIAPNGYRAVTMPLFLHDPFQLAKVKREICR
jgi:hypothetical protein